jgi:hypothetical protein
VIATVRLATAATVTAVGIALALAAQASPASAAEQPAAALISLDGMNFSATPQGSLFPAGVVLIPGGTADATIWVRNSSGAPADLRIAVSDATTTAAAFVESLTLQAATPATPAGTPVPLSSDDCTPVLSGEVIAAGETTQVHIVLAMSPDSDNAGQGASAGAKLAVSLSEVTGGVSLPPNCEATTGVPVMPSGGDAAGASADNSAANGADGEVADTSAGPAPAVGDIAGDPAPSAGQQHQGLALPTLPFGGQRAMMPGILAGLAALAAGVAAFVLVLRKKRRAQ